MIILLFYQLKLNNIRKVKYLLKLIRFRIILDEWHVLLNRYRLMESPHGELGSNTHVILDQNQVVESKKKPDEL